MDHKNPLAQHPKYEKIKDLGQGMHPLSKFRLRDLLETCCTVRYALPFLLMNMILITFYFSILAGTFGSVLHARNRQTGTSLSLQNPY